MKELFYGNTVDWKFVWTCFLGCQNVIIDHVNSGVEHCVAMGTVTVKTPNQSVLSLNPVKSSRCFLEHKTLPSWQILNGTGWFLE